MLTDTPATAEPADPGARDPAPALCAPLWAELPPTGVDSHDVLARRTQRLLARGWGLPW